MPSDTLGQRITCIRGNIRQEDFAQHCGISRKTLIRYEKNERMPPADFLQILIKDFGADPQWLLMGGLPPKGLNPRESALIANYRASPEEGRRSLETTSALLAKSQTGKNVKKAG
ncbi:helix-turn-helix domain-containing protein [Pseudodesulfovibrio sp. JC047]|uniref:helix-turn-helix domain-containing protein n=1 Tax=Pseudodesulfovibrio sp. JC047 TaxID=2683199 RepID=UPI0013D12750|nr:helix-turn-helix transcriptional regulator [Pseudodesulfovibrio sp. JC047]NDV20860.1 helix-turn-helix domain-containing protein [Pseudodesulfovibrio sp. JC047]